MSNAFQSVRTVNLSRAYEDDFALVDVTTVFNSGSATAVLGPNGAGKSTLISLLTTLTRPTEGELYFGDQKISAGDTAIRSQIGYVGHQTMVYGSLTARENLHFFGRMYGVDDLDGRVEQQLEMVGLSRDADRAVSEFSRGMSQRLSIARALLPNPGLLLLDEPFTGLDQRGIDMARTLFCERRDAGAILVMVSHDLAIAGLLADRALVLRRGRVVFEGAVVDNLAATYREALEGTTS